MVAGGQRHHQPIIVPYVKHGPGPFAADLLIVDENTGAQLDCPPHMMPPLESGLPNAGYWGTMTCEKVPVWQFLGEAVRVDGRKILDQAPNGVSPIYTIDMIKQAEQEIGRSLAPATWCSTGAATSTEYDRPGEAGKRLHIAPIEETAPGFPAPNFDAEDYLGSKGVRRSPSTARASALWRARLRHARAPGSMNQTPKAIESHLGLFKYGGIDIEGLINFDKAPNGLAVHRPAGQARQGHRPPRRARWRSPTPSSAGSCSPR